MITTGVSSSATRWLSPAVLAAFAAVGPATVIRLAPVASNASDGGKAVLEFELAGPKGRNTVHVNAVSNGGVWKISNLVLTPPGA